MATEQKRMRQINATEATWLVNDPVLLDGELAMSSDVRRFKVGPGQWSGLPYWGGTDDLQAPVDGILYGLKNGVWSPGVDWVETPVADLNTITSARAQFFRVADNAVNGWNGLTANDVVLDLSHPDSANRVQVAYSYSDATAPQAVVHTRVFRGTWSNWITNVAFAEDIYTGNLDDIALGAGSYAATVYVSTAVTNGWPGLQNNSVVETIQIGPDTAVQRGWNGATAEQWFRTKEEGSWSVWQRQQIAEDDVFDLDRVRWVYPYTPGQSMEENDMVLFSPWTVVANKDTSDIPITEATDPIWLGDGATILPRGTVNEATYFTGQVYAWADGGYFEGYRFDPPVRSAAFEYSVFAAIQNADGDVSAVQQVVPWQTFGGNPGEWITVPQATNLWSPGTTAYVWMGVRSVVQPNTFTAPWSVKNVNGDPSEGEANFQNNSTEIRVHDVDSNDSNQGDNLTAVQPGGTLQFAGQEWTITAVNDFGDHVRYTLAPNQGRPTEADRQLTFTWGSSDPLPVNEDATFWAGNTAIRGLEGVDLNNQTVTDAQYPIDLLVREITKSPDWDIVTVSGGGGGGGGGGGATTFLGLTDTPTDYGNPNDLVSVNPTGDGLAYLDGGGLPYLPLTGGTTTGDVTFDRHSLFWRANASHAFTLVDANNADAPMFRFFLNYGSGFFELVDYVNGTNGTTIRLFDKNAAPSSTSIQFRDRNGTIAARLSDAGTNSPSSGTIITREKGDVRYTQVAAMKALLNELQNKGVLTGGETQAILDTVAVDPPEPDDE